MVRRAFWLVPIALITSAANALAQPPPRVQQAPPVFPEMPQDAWRDGPSPDTRATSRRFTRAVKSFDNAIQQLDAAPNNRDLAFAIERFARALESAPYAEQAGVSSAVADMRAAVRDVRCAGPPESSAVRRAFSDALFIGADALVDLAYGPYRASREVTAQAWELENTLERMQKDDLPSDRRLTLALRQSVLVMNVMIQTPSTTRPPR